MVRKIVLGNPQSLSSTGANAAEPRSDIDDFIPWESGTWPNPPPTDSRRFTSIIKQIVEVAVLLEISNVIKDVKAQSEDFDHRGFAVCASLFCALDTISAFGYVGESGAQIPEFISAHFPREYHQFARELGGIVRNASVHSWNTFFAEILSGNDGISRRDGRISFGLLNFFDALKSATEDFLERLARTPKLQETARKRYKWLLKHRDDENLKNAPGSGINSP